MPVQAGTQQLLPSSGANAGQSRRSLTIQNNNASDSCYLFIGGTQITPATTALSTNITVNGNTIQTAASFDYEAKSSYSVRVRSTDQGGLWTEKAFTVTVTVPASRYSMSRA